MLNIIILLLIIAAVTVFSVQNADPVSIKFLFWRFEASLAIIIFLCALAGLIAGVTIVSASRMKKSLQSRR